MSRIDRLPNGTNESTGDEADKQDDPRLVSAVQEYLASVEAGKPLNRRDLIARHPDLARELNDCLSGLAFLRAAAGGIQDDRTEPILQRAESPHADAELADARPLGDFKLVREIGRGGMGVVYEALQLSLGRRVAVKVLSMAAALDSRQLQRFRNEAQAAAQLHHTNIVPVHAVGCERSVHFYAMQLIEGRSLSELIAEMRAANGNIANGNGRAAGSSDKATSDAPTVSFNATAPAPVSPPKPPTVGLVSRSFEVEPERSSVALNSRLSWLHGSTGAEAAPASAGEIVTAATLPGLHAHRRPAYYRTVARLGMQAADALDYAHRAGVVHRDVKPANLLLDGAGTLWMTDFGLAQLQSDHQLTQAGETVGTLQYMSPEQASGRAVVLDQRTDIYSLGVTLYELLTLERAFTGSTREQLLYKIEIEEPRPPRSIDRAIPAELETILATAMAKEPAERYPTARALVDDLNRFLRDEPIRAKRPSWRSRVFKWGRRHRSLVAASIVILVLAAAGLLTSTVLIAREQAKTEAAYIRETEKVIEANRERAKAQKSSAQAREVVSFLGRVAADDLADIPDAAAIRKEMLEAALDYLEGFLEDHGNDPAIAEQLAEAETNVASILAELSAFEEWDRVQSRVRLLEEPAVADTLKVNKDQTAKIKTLSGSLRGRFFDSFRRATGEQDTPGGPDMKSRGALGLTAKQRSEVVSTLASDTDDELNDIITAAQANRLAQIARQVRGPTAFGDPDVLAAMSPNREQRVQIRRIQADARRLTRDLLRHGPWDRREDNGERLREARKQSVSQIVARLTPAQLTAWQSLTGEPFTAPVSFDQGFRGGGFGGGPGRQPSGPNRGPPPVPGQGGPSVGNPNDHDHPPGDHPPGERRDRPKPERGKDKGPEPE